MTLLNVVIPKEENTLTHTDFSTVSTNQCLIVSLDNIFNQIRELSAETHNWPFDRIDHTFSQTPDLKYLFPVTLKYPIYRPEKKPTALATPNTASIFSRPVKHYVYGLRKIII